MIDVRSTNCVRIGHWLCLLMLLVMAGAASAAELRAADLPLTQDEILDGIENRYAGPGFAADFFQESTLKEMGVTDIASGMIFVKRPGMMRWEYEKPEKQSIITDSEKLWIYRPEDNQLMVGEAPSYFGDGKGASFLSDMKQVRKKFTISLEFSDNPLFYLLKLVPVRKNIDLNEIYLTISKKTFDIEKIVTFNAFGDKTRITLSRFDFTRTRDDSFFRFSPPKGVDVLQLDR